MLIFVKKLPLAIFLKKNENFEQLKKKCHVFGNFLTVKWQFSGGSGHHLVFYRQVVHLCVEFVI